METIPLICSENQQTDFYMIRTFFTKELKISGNRIFTTKDNDFLIIEPEQSIHIYFRSSRPEVFLEKGVLKIYSKFTEEHPCRSVVSSNFGMGVLQ